MNFDFLKQFNITTTQLVKFSLFTLIAVAVLVFMNVVTNQGGSGMNTLGIDDYAETSVSPSMGMPAYRESDSYNQKLSVRNVTTESMPPIYNGYTSGADAEAFEVKNYSAQIETRNLERDCEAIRALKARTDVIFENANEYDRGCAFTFKVEKGSVEAILAIIKDLDPKELGENTYTIKREVEDYTSAIQVYENKLASLDTTLTNALASYENITELATRTGDVESLAKIIDSKIALIERLTGARIETQNQLDAIARAKADALDRLAYTYFTVNVYESKYADGEALKESWKFAVQQFVREVNAFAQEMSIGLIMLLLFIAKVALYGTLLLLGVKFGWKFVRKTWQS
jgi:hypothetical protein